MRGLFISISTLAVALGAACGPTANPAETDDEEGPGPEIRLPPRSSGEFDCQDIPEAGVCRDDVAIYCDRRSSSIVEKRCGARSLSCEVTERGASCVDAEGNEEEVPAEGGEGEGCGDVTYAGECDEDGNVLYCSGAGELVTLECDTANGQEMCGLRTFTSTDDYYDCLPVGCPADLVQQDQCDGDILRTCVWNSDTEMYEEETGDCTEDGNVCVEDSEWNVAYCTAPEEPPGPTCEELGVVGACKDATTYHYCVDEENGIQEFDCSAVGQICGFNGTIYTCVDDVGP